MPLRFEPNVGQVDAPVDFLARGAGYALYLDADEAVLSLDGPGDGRSVLSMRMLGADPDARPSAGDRLPGTSNYFIGDDPSRWRSDVPTHASVTYDDVYPGIDLVYRGDGGRLEYDFVVAPGADPGVIEVDFDGADRLTLDPSGNLVIGTDSGEVVQRAPVLYQESGTGRSSVAGRFVLSGDDRVRYEVGPHDPTLPLVIDPILDYSTYLGGSDIEDLAGVTGDGTGAVLLVGRTESVDFPGASSGYQPFLRDPSDIFIAKLAPDGRSLEFATYLGGNGEEATQARAALDPAGNIYVCGTTLSRDFPTSAEPVPGRPARGRRLPDEAQPRRQPSALLHLHRRQRQRLRHERGRRRDGRDVRPGEHQLRPRFRRQRERLPAPARRQARRVRRQDRPRHPRGQLRDLPRRQRGRELLKPQRRHRRRPRRQRLRHRRHALGQLPGLRGAIPGAVRGRTRRLRHQAQRDRLGRLLLDLPRRARGGDGA